VNVQTATVIGRDVTLAYGVRVALASATFTLARGTLTAVIGPNGSGKSTLLNAIAGLLEPVTGQVEVLGAPPAQVRWRISYVLQSTKVNEMLPVTVQEVVAMGRYARLGPYRRFTPHDHQAVQRALERLDIALLADRRLDELSGGQRQRAFVAQGLAQESEVLLLDEPVTGLDLVSRDRILQAVTEERAEGATVVMTTHALDEANLADQVLLVAGHIVAAGAPNEVLTPAHLAEAYGYGVAGVQAERLVLDDAHHRPAAHREEHRRHEG
jgi:manganese transport system ATP-binding protein